MDKELSLYSLSMMADLILEQFNINLSTKKGLIEILKELEEHILTKYLNYIMINSMK